jgi:lipopolysaccharide transport system ATP-binding protein
MSDVVIAVEKLSKRYLIGHQARRQAARHGSYTALRDVIAREARDLVRKGGDLVRGRQTVEGDEISEFWALKNVSFEVKQGEVLGIVGRNGAGKSTLFKILSRITEPTEGRVVLRGRVASLLEVGTGFHPELTGRENISLNGAILGMTRHEINKKFDAIVAFAEVEEFLDTPVKRYSSGMYVRLAFAVAAHLEPEILLVDEILAVGDSEFQKKCLGKMDEVSRREGRTVVFVSHNMATLTSLCPNAIWLDHGSIRQNGVARDVVSNYLVQEAPNRDRLIRLGEAPRDDWLDDDRLRFECLEWHCDLPLKHGEPVKARIHFKTRSPVLDVAIAIGFFNLEGRRLIAYRSDLELTRPSLTRPGAYSVDIEMNSLPLAPDNYILGIHARSGDSYWLDVISVAAQIEIVAGSTTPWYIVRKDVGVCGVCEWAWNNQNGGRQ